MPRFTRRILARVSRALNRIAGGAPGETLCARVAHTFGHDCLFCRAIDRLTERDHCWRELVGKLTTTIKK